VPWAQPLLREIKLNGGLVGANMTRFFELRQEYALHKAGIMPGYEVPGEGHTSQAGIRGTKTSAYSLLFASRIRFTIGIEKFDSDRTSMGAVTT
jgi:hypothetical protein